MKVIRWVSRARRTGSQWRRRPLCTCLSDEDAWTLAVVACALLVALVVALVTGK
jgi:hypothetical protein